MSTPTLITLPTSSCVAEVVLTLRRAVSSTQSPFTMESQEFKWPGTQWMMEFEMPPFTNRSVAEDWICFGLQLEGGFNRFLMGDPSAKNPRGVATGTPKVNGADQFGKTLLTDGWTPNTTNILMKGDYLQLGTGLDTQLYKSMSNVNSNASGEASILLHTDLRSSPNDNADIVVNNAKGLFKLSSSDFSWSVSKGGIYRVNFSASEVVSA